MLGRGHAGRRSGNHAENEEIKATLSMGEGCHSRGPGECGLEVLVCGGIEPCWLWGKGRCNHWPPRELSLLPAVLRCLGSLVFTANGLRSHACPFLHTQHGAFPSAPPPPRVATTG